MIVLKMMVCLKFKILKVIVTFNFIIFVEILLTTLGIHIFFLVVKKCEIIIFQWLG